MITRPTSRLAAKEATITSGRMLRSMQKFLMSGSETGRDAGGDYFKEHRGPVMEPERHGAAQGQRAKAGGTPDDRGSHPALRRGGRNHPVLGGNRLNHAIQIGPVP